MALHIAEIIDLSWIEFGAWPKYIVPAVIIFIGMKLIMSRTRRNSNRGDGLHDADLSNLQDGDRINASVVFSGTRYNMNDQMFNGAKIDVFCGGVSLDLCGAEITDKCTIEVHTLMGGVEIKAPSNVKFLVSSKSFMGGVDNKHNQTSDSCTKTIYIKADCLLGGVEVK